MVALLDELAVEVSSCPICLDIIHSKVTRNTVAPRSAQNYRSAAVNKHCHPPLQCNTSTAKSEHRVPLTAAPLLGIKRVAHHSGPTLIDSEIVTDVDSDLSGKLQPSKNEPETTRRNKASNTTLCIPSSSPMDP